MNKQQLANLQKRIARSNGAFARMTPAQKRVQIAKDVLAQMELGRVRAKKGTYFDLGAKAEKAFAKLYSNVPETELQEVLKETQKCNVCAIGAAFLCTVERVDKFKLSNLSWGTLNNGDEEMREYLDENSVFTKEHLAILEGAFEGWESVDPDPDDEYSGAGAWDFSKFNRGARSHQERLRRVMQAVIDCKGEIEPELFGERRTGILT